jgi:hypothetical protein
LFGEERTMYLQIPSSLILSDRPVTKKVRTVAKFVILYL